MEPESPPFEISGEEDTLISASPLVSLKDKGDAENCSSSSASGNANKENINVKKSELTKLSVETQQMKRRKRSGAYNLRKSLAWDQAFSTDEGFLNPLELSMLGGSNGNSCREMLPSISEDGKMYSDNSYSRGDSPDVQGTPRVMSNKKGSSSSGSKSCCPRPLNFSSLKRSANTNMLKAATKESKLPKLPFSKSDAHSLLKSGKSNLPSTSQTRDNQIGREADIHKVARSQSSSKVTRTSLCKHKSGSDFVSVSAKSPMQRTKRNKVHDNVAGKLFSSSGLQPQQSSRVTRANCSQKAPSTAIQPSGSYTKDSHAVVMKNRACSEKESVAPTMLNTVVQSRKPSGLRMPSPSLGFFSQPKSSGPNSLSERATQLINITGSSVPNSPKVNILNSTYHSRLPRFPMKLPEKVNNYLSNRYAELSGSRLKDVSSSNDHNTHESRTVEEAEKCVLVKELSRAIKQNQAAQTITGCDNIAQEESENSCKIDHISIQPHMDLQKNENHGLMEDESSDQLNKKGNNDEVDSLESKGSDNIHLEYSSCVPQISCQQQDQDVHGTIDAIHCLLEKDNQPSSSPVVPGAIPEPWYESSTGSFMQDSTLMTHNDDSNCMLDADQCKTKTTESDPEIDDNVVLTNKSVWNDIVLFDDKHNDSPKSLREDTANGASKLCESKKNEILCYLAPSRTSAEQENQDDSGSNHVRDEYLVADDNVELLVISEAAEKCEGVDAHETCSDVFLELNRSDIIDENHGVNEEFDTIVSNFFEQPPVDASVSGVNMCAELFFGRKEEAGGANDVRNHMLSEKAETEDFPNREYLENQKSMVEDSKIPHQFHSREPVMTTCLRSTDLSFPENCQTSCLPSEMVVDKCETVGATKILCIRDAQEQTLVGSNSRPIIAAADNIDFEVFADTNIELGQPEMQNPTIVADHIFLENHGSPSNDCTSDSERSSREAREGLCLQTALTAQEQTNRNQVQGSKYGSGVSLEGIGEENCLADEPSGSITTKTFNEHDVNCLDEVLKNNISLTGQATYMDSYVASIARGGQTSDLIDTYGQICSGETSGFIDQKIQVSPKSNNAVDTRVDEIHRISSADIKLNSTQENESLITKQHYQDTTKCHTEDANATLLTERPEDGEMIHNLAIKPTVNAIPFSDEWLAAMEAAGEEILTMKRGAVQNSPTNKALPEPSPWSPVKKKQNQIGPYDCTKFINVPLPPNSD